MLKINLKVLLLILTLGVSILPLVSSVKAIEFPDAPKREEPKSTAAGGRRGGCVSGNIPITPLTPGSDHHIKTVSPQPTFFVYIPPTKAKFLEFILKDSQGNSLDSQEITLTENDRILGIHVGQNVNLEANKTYQWEISLMCNPMVLNTSNYTKGTIERVILDDKIKQELLANQDILEQAQIYANNNIWQETIALVASLQSEESQEWKELLTSVGLENLSEKSLIFQGNRK